jgi:hypothetical protein
MEYDDVMRKNFQKSFQKGRPRTENRARVMGVTNPGSTTKLSQGSHGMGFESPVMEIDRC